MKEKKKSPHNKIKSKRGVAMVEFCIVMTLIIVLLAMFFSGGQMVLNKNVLNYAAQTAAREASVRDTYGEACTVAKDKAIKTLKDNGVDTKNIKVVCSVNGSWSKGNNLTVKVSMDYQTLFPTPNAGNDSLSTKTNTMSSSITVMIECD